MRPRHRRLRSHIFSLRSAKPSRPRASSAGSNERALNAERVRSHTRAFTRIRHARFVRVDFPLLALQALSEQIQVVFLHLGLWDATRTILAHALRFRRHRPPSDKGGTTARHPRIRPV